MKNKLKSRRGASLLMALMFLMVSMLVGTSVLMAAAANANRIASNRAEQQKYLTLSSALNLLVEELESVEYVGTYTHTLTPITPIDEEDDSYLHSYNQTKGEFRLRVGSTWDLKDVLPLHNDMDAIFAKNFVEEQVRDKQDGDEYNDFVALSLTIKFYALTLTVDPAPGVDYGGLTDPVEITVRLQDDGSIVLTASLQKESTYSMEAVLVPEYGLGQLYLEGHRIASDVRDDHTTEPITWKLDYIIKKRGGGG